jgi:hypothetical protein
MQVCFCVRETLPEFDANVIGAEENSGFDRCRSALPIFFRWG